MHCCRESETIIISTDPTNEAKVQRVEVSGYLIRGMEVGVSNLLEKFEGIGWEIWYRSLPLTFPCKL